MILIFILMTGLLPFNVFLEYEGNQADKGVVQTDLGCLTAGNTPLDQSGNTQILLAAYNNSGEFLYTDSFHLGQSSQIFAVQNFIGGIIFTGSWTDASTGVNAFAYAMSHDGQKLWTYSLEMNDLETFTTAAQGTNGDIVCAGRTKSFGAGGSDVLLVALDQSGNELWQKSYGTPGEEAVYHISACDDGGYILACQAMEWGAGLGDYWIIRTDSSGDTLWTGTYGGPEFDYPWRVIQSGLNFYVAGNTLSFGSGSYDWWILKLDSSGNLIWDTTWGYKNTDSCMALSVRDGNAVVAGASEPALNQYQATVVVFNEDGSVSDEFFYDAGMIRSIETLDNDGFLVGGVFNHETQSLWTMCTDALGNSPEMGLSVEVPYYGVKLLTNPVFMSAAIKVLDGSSSLTIFDLYGRILGTVETSGEITFLDVSTFSTGIYSVQSSNGAVVRMAVIR